MDLTYDELGDANNPPLVILHGFFASARNWRQVATALAEQYHVIVLNLRNHGDSPHAEKMTYPLMAEDLKAFLQDKNLTQVNLIGHSMGGKVAMWFALHYPAMLKQLIVVDIAPVSYTHSFDAMIDALMALPLASLGNRKQADNLLAPAIEDFGFRQFLLQNLVLREGRYQWRIDLEIFKNNAPNIIAFPAIEASSSADYKALFVTGSNSDYILPNYEAAVYEVFPGAKISQIAHAGHWLHAEQPQLFIELVREYLSC